MLLMRFLRMPLPIALMMVLAGTEARAQTPSGNQAPAPTPAAAAPLPPLLDYARFSDYSDLTVSPDGEYVAAKIRLEDRDALGIIRLSDMKMTGTIKLTEKQSVGQYWWVGPQRVAVTVNVPGGPLAAPSYAGEIVAKDADGSKYSYVAGYRDLQAIDTRVPRRQGIQGWSWIVDSPLKDPARAIISVDSWNTVRGGGNSTVHEVNTFSGITKKITHAPFRGNSPGNTDYLTDRSGRVRYVSGIDVQNKPQAWYREGDGEDWVKLNTDALAGIKIWPLAFSADDSKVYLSSQEAGDRYCLVEHTLASNQRRALACDPAADLAHVIFSFDGGTRPIAAVFAAGKPSVVPLEPESQDGRMFAAMMRAFPGHIVIPGSQTLDGRMVILFVYSDVNPGDYYLFDTKTKNARYLMRSYSWIDPARQAQTLPISFKARDGQALYGFLTVPPGRPAQKLPLVVMPHGGPLGIRDHWEWDPDAQALASRGYAVLKVNFRGSSGYGNAFREAGERAWGTRMIDDITDAVKWTVAQGHADGSRLCIYGASYGGFAALMSAVREPEMYKCAIGYAGVYNLANLKDDTIYTQRRAGVIYFDETMGDKDEDLLAQSPISYLDKLKAAVMIVHGREDEIAPWDQAVELAKGLERRKYPFEWLEKPREGHGFYKVENREELLRKVIAFLDRHIGDAATPSAAPAAAR